MPGHRLVLASASPQRRAILEQLGIAFDVVPPDVEEATAGEPRDLVTRNAVAKASAVATRAGARPGELVLSADTAVALPGRVYGKPRDEREARSFLEALSGREHQVWSGVALIGGGPRPGRDAEPKPPSDSSPRTPAARAGAAVTTVRFRHLRETDLDWYLHTGEWRGRAAGYAIQGRGAALVEGVEGDFWNVVGLPVTELLRLDPNLLRR